MRFIKKDKVKNGDIKIVNKFILIPRIINNDIRWLEFAKIKYVYYEDYSWNGQNMSIWMAEKFLD